MTRIAAVTSTRADYGLLSRLMTALNNDPDLEFKLIVTGTHLSAKHGMTVDEISADGFAIDARISIDMDSGNAVELTASAGDLTQQMAQCFKAMKPEAVVVLGDRFEILPVAYAAAMQGIAVIHLHGGELTLGAIDNKMRFAISRLADLHLVATETSRQRLIAGGTPDEHVVMTGAPGVEHALTMAKASRQDIETRTGARFYDKNILFTFHPETMSGRAVEDQISAALTALGEFDDIGKFISLPNADPGNQVIRDQLMAFSESHPHVHLTSNLGHHLYLSLLGEVDAVVGNSSSGIIEAPALGTTTVNIGCRQEGREQAASVIQCDCTADAITSAISTALSRQDAPHLSDHPYYREGTCRIMISAIKDFLSC